AMATTAIGIREKLFLGALLLAGFCGGIRAADENVRNKALALNDVTGEETIKAEGKLLASNADTAQKLLTEALAMAKEKDQPFHYTAAYILANVAQEVRQLEAGQTFYRLCIDLSKTVNSATRLVESYLGLVELYYDLEKYAESEKACREFLELDNPDPRVKRAKSIFLPAMVQALAKQKKTTEALKIVTDLLKIRSDDWQTLGLKGFVEREAGNYADAVKTYEDVLDKIAKDNTLDVVEQKRRTEGYRYLLSILYVDLNGVEKVTEHLKAMRTDEPNDPTYNNDLGYIWADHNMNLDEAEKMIQKAIDEDRKKRKADPKLKPENDKDNAAYLDSLGWVYFKKKKYAEAKDLLLKAVQDPKDGQHTDIYDHLGD